MINTLKSGVAACLSVCLCVFYVNSLSSLARSLINWINNQATSNKKVIQRVCSPSVNDCMHSNYIQCEWCCRNSEKNVCELCSPLDSGSSVGRISTNASRNSEEENVRARAIGIGWHRSITCVVFSFVCVFDATTASACVLIAFGVLPAVRQ